MATDMELSSIIKYIRNAASLSQESFADKIGVTRLTVTRWENDVSVPNKIAQRKIYDVAKEHNAEFFDLIISDMPVHDTENEKIILYHASDRGITGPIGPKSRDNCDFGRGFYMGTHAEQPLTLIFSSDKDDTEKAVMYTVELDLKGLNVLYVPPDIDWTLLVAYYRNKMKRYGKTALYERYSRMLAGYDVVAGKIADDRIFTALDLFFRNLITDKGVIECLSALPLGDQYAALTEKACRQIRILEQRSFSEIERLCINDASERNRRSGVAAAEEVRKGHRREGRYFDEIMEERG